jgi:biopolymer transport protein ExbB
MKRYLLLLITLVSVAVSWVIWNQSPTYIKQGGPLLVLGLTSLFLVLTFTVERMIVLWRAGGRSDATSFIRKLKKSIEAGNVEEAIAICKKQGGSLGNVVGAGLERFAAFRGYHATEKDLIDETKRALDEATALENPVLDKNLNALSTIASIATMLGLLGTTIGMIRAFHAMSRAGAPDAIALAIGISEALVNTALGLTTAILGIVLYNYFTARVDSYGNAMEETGFQVLELLRRKEMENVSALGYRDRHDSHVRRGLSSPDLLHDDDAVQVARAGRRRVANLAIGGARPGESVDPADGE